MPPVWSNVLTTTELWVINSWFHKFLRLCGCNGLPHGRSCCFLKAKGHPFEVLLKFNPRVGSGRKILIWNFYFGIVRINFASGPLSGELLVNLKRPVSPLVCNLCFFFFFLSLCVQSLLRGLLRTDAMAGSSHCSWNCSRNLDCKWCSPPAFMHSREMMKSVGKLWWLSCSHANCRQWSRNGCVSYDGRCHGYRGTSMRYMCMDFSAGHGCWPTQFRITTSDVDGRFRTPHARRVPKISW
jgi:hypothetical protein